MIPLPTAAPIPLQATFVPSENAIAWWGPSDVASALVEATNLVGRAASIRLAIPDGASVVAKDVAVVLTDVAEAARTLDDIDSYRHFEQSVLAWKEASRITLHEEPSAGWGRLVEQIPPAGHAILDADETSIMAPAVLLHAFRLAVSSSRLLRSGVIQADLRPYQNYGVAWLRDRAQLGAGAILADEMGLGKTLQSISVLATRRSATPHLVVCPTSLIGNWRREIQRFSPTTPVLRYHGTDRHLPASFAPGSVVITSYPLLRSDPAVNSTEWDVVIFDEAQQLKNPTAEVTRAALQLKSTCRIAMTGTPVENNLDELWSIFSVTNPALLGPRARFRQRFVAPIQQRRSTTAATTLSKLVQPHMLRRTKAQVATELPPRLDSTVVCTLTNEQIALYRRTVDQAFTNDGLGSGIGRSGRVLALITALKQICNHPAQYQGASTAEPGRSGKYDRAMEMLAEIVDDGERALVFTQYRAMGDLLSTGLEQAIQKTRIPFLHGGLSAARRDELVRAFQEDDDSPPILVLSLRAAGFGLNLTRASHVLHFDRWWNPAVEEQATARAHRIGQTQTLTVHTLITEGTIEDHIDRMHHEKQGIADTITGDPTTALAALPDRELRNILDLNTAEVS